MVDESDHGTGRGLDLRIGEGGEPGVGPARGELTGIFGEGHDRSAGAVEATPTEFGNGRAGLGVKPVDFWGKIGRSADRVARGDDEDLDGGVRQTD